MPFSRLATLLADRAFGSRPREKPLLIKLQPGKIGVAFRQRPEGVHVIGQDANRDRFKRSTLLDCPVNPPEAVDFLEQKVARPFGKNNREKEDAALDFCSTILRHSELYHEASWWARRKSAFAHPTKLRWL